MPSRTVADVISGDLRRYHPFRHADEIIATDDRVLQAKAVSVAIAAGLKKQFGASKVMLFGSLARDNFHICSDIDLGVWGVAPDLYYRAVAFTSGFSDQFGVDLVDADDCSESLLQHILREGIEL